MHELISSHFHNYSPSFQGKLADMIEGMLHSGSSSTAAIARSLSALHGDDFKTHDMRIYRFLQDKEFQIDDKLWRGYVGITLQILREKKLLACGERLDIRVDFTSSTDEFLILSASIDMGGRAIPLYFSCRKYPKKKNQMDQKKMEEAFIKALQHILPKKYPYVIVADRGFGNQRFAGLCKNAGFGYVLRMCENLNIVVDQKDGSREETNIADYAGRFFDIRAHVKTWKEDHRFVGCVKDNQHWVLMTHLDDSILSTQEVYQSRFAIEKSFQDQKSSGFDMEQSKIKKYNRFKRCYFCVCLAQVLAVSVGQLIHEADHPFKKRFPAHHAVILAYFKWGERLLSCTSSTQ